jgi:hypothetical protein
MVRIKYRYLLVNILYPELEKIPSQTQVPDVVVFNQPTSGALTPYPLLKAIEAEVQKLFGDYGAGTIKASLQSKPFIFISYALANDPCSKIPLTRYLNIYHSRLARSLPACMGRPDLHEECPSTGWEELCFSGREG